jgi:hypothetical protein
MKKNRLIVVLSFAIIAIIGSSVLVFANLELSDSDVKGFGAIRMTPDEVASFHESMDEVVAVQFNSLAVERIKNSDTGRSAYESLVPVDVGSEIITDKDVSSGGALSLNSSALSGVSGNAAQLAAAAALPSSVDNSTSNYFPAIGDQVASSSCTAWSVGYYQMTNNIALVRGLNTKSGANVTKYRISPKWVYALINGGADQGSRMDHALNVATEFGAPSWYVCDGSTSGNNYNYKTWHPGATIWENALSNKMDSYMDIPLNSLDLLKSTLLNGYVVSFSTSIGDWKIKSIPSGSPSAAGQYICTSVHDTHLDGNGVPTDGHAMTIVGYNDNIWVDINNNGVVDTGETGALKIANSWGTSTWKPYPSTIYQHNSGFIWLSYDALKSQSSISGANNSNNRTGAIWYDTAYLLLPRVSYSPLLLAEVTLNTARRNQISIEIGISSNSQTSPSKTLDCISDGIAFNNSILAEGASDYSFTGTSSAADGTFIFDLTPIVKKYYDENGGSTGLIDSKKFYIRLSDNVSDSYPCTIKSFKLIDRYNNVLTDSTVSLPVSANNSTASAYASYTLPERIIVPNSTFIVDFSFPVQPGTIASGIKMYNSSNSQVTIQRTMDSTNKKATISFPSGTNKSGCFYKLEVNSNVTTFGGNTISNPLEFKLYFL